MTRTATAPARTPSRRAIFTLASAAAVAAVSAPAVAATIATAPDPAVIAWRELKRAMRLYHRLDGAKCELHKRRDEMTSHLRPGEGATPEQRKAYCQAVDKAGVECGYAAAWQRWNEAHKATEAPLQRLIATRPTTARGVLAKVAAAQWLIKDGEEHRALEVLKGVLAIDPATLTK